MAADFGKGFTVANLKNMRQFHTTFPIGQTLSDQLSWSQTRSTSPYSTTPKTTAHTTSASDTTIAATSKAENGYSL